MPPDPKKFCLLVQMFVGSTESHGLESCDVTVCTTRWLADHDRNDDLVILRRVILVREDSYARLEQRLRAVVEVHRDETWTQIAERVGQVGHSEHRW